MIYTVHINLAAQDMTSLGKYRLSGFLRQLSFVASETVRQSDGLPS